MVELKQAFSWCEGLKSDHTAIAINIFLKNPSIPEVSTEP